MSTNTNAITNDRGTLVLGIGNLLWADEGFGVRAVQSLHGRWRFGDGVTLMDGGTQGFNLLSFVQSAERMIVFDAIDCGLPPGTLKVLEDTQVPRFMGSKKLSLHQTGFQDVLAVAELTGRLPSRLVLIGVQPEEMDDFGGSLRAIVRAQILPAEDVALSYLRHWGCTPVSRPASESASASLLVSGLDLAAYEAVRGADATGLSGAARVTSEAR